MANQKYRRTDENGKPVDVEIWRSPDTGEITMLRRITYYVEHGKNRKFRNDFPRNCPEFKRALRKEILFLQEYARIGEILERELNGGKSEPPAQMQKEQVPIAEAPLELDGMEYMLKVFPPQRHRK